MPRLWMITYKYVYYSIEIVRVASMLLHITERPYLNRAGARSPHSTNRNHPTLSHEYVARARLARQINLKIGRVPHMCSSGWMQS